MAPLTAHLDRHQVRRRQGLPTLSLLVGSAETVLGGWRAWAKAERRAVVPVFEPSVADAVLPWFQPPHADAGGRLAEPVWIGCAILGSEIPDPALPALILVCTEPVGDTWRAMLDQPHALSVFVEELAQLSGRVPSLPLALAVPNGIHGRLRQGLSSDRLRSWLDEALVTLPEPARPPDGKRVDLSPPSHPSPQSLTYLARLGADPAILAEFQTALSGPGPDATDKARSRAEALLYLSLDLHPETRGRFRLNQRLPILPDGATLEIDLFAVSLSLAVEVDGVHHLASPDQYRLDRRKDYALQRHGCMITRVLAADVFDRLEDCIGLVVAAARHQSGRSLRPVPPCRPSGAPS